MSNEPTEILHARAALDRVWRSAVVLTAVAMIGLLAMIGALAVDQSVIAVILLFAWPAGVVLAGMEAYRAKSAASSAEDLVREWEAARAREVIAGTTTPQDDPRIEVAGRLLERIGETGQGRTSDLIPVLEHHLRHLAHDITLLAPDADPQVAAVRRDREAQLEALLRALRQLHAALVAGDRSLDDPLDQLRALAEVEVAGSPLPREPATAAAAPPGRQELDPE